MTTNTNHDHAGEQLFATPVGDLDTPAADLLTPSDADPTHPVTIPQQLSLLPEPTAKPRFRLDLATRERGLRHVREIRNQLSVATAADSTTPVAARRTAA